MTGHWKGYWERGRKQNKTQAWDESVPQTSFVTLPCTTRNWYSGTDTVTYELPDSAKEKGEEILPLCAMGPSAEGAVGELRTHQGQEGSRDSLWSMLQLQSRLDPGCERHPSTLLSCCVGLESGCTGFNPNAGVNLLCEAKQITRPFRASLSLAVRAPWCACSMPTSAPGMGDIDSSLVGSLPWETGSAGLGAGKQEGELPGGSSTYLTDKKEVFRGKVLLKEDIPESKKRTKVREVLSNSVCMETTDYMKAENDERWD